MVLYAMIAVYPFPFIDLTPVKANRSKIEQIKAKLTDIFSSHI